MFGDVETSIVGFEKIPVKKLQKRDTSTLTTQNQHKEQCIQTGPVFTNAACQTESNQGTQRVYDNDDQSLLNFLKKVLPKLEEELNKPSTSNAIQIGDFEDDTFTRRIGSLQKYNCDYNGMIVNRLRWNSNGSSIAVSLVYRSHTSWCKHTSYLIIYKTDIYGEIVFEIAKTMTLNTCITDIEYHPISPYILAVTTDEGKIFIYNFRYRDNASIVQLDSFGDNQRITQIAWTKKSNSVLLAAAGFNGCLALWNEPHFDEGDYKINQKCKFQTSDGKIHDKIMLFEFSPLREDYLIVAIEGGILLGCTTTETSAISLTSGTAEYVINTALYTYEIPTLAVNCIKFSPVINDLFAVSCSNDSVRIYTFTQKVPIQVIHPICTIFGLEWNFNQSDVLKMWAIDGNVYFYDTASVSVIRSINISERPLLCSSYFRRRNNQEMVFVDSDGDISIWKSSVCVTKE